MSSINIIKKESLQLNKSASIIKDNLNKIKLNDKINNKEYSELIDILLISETSKALHKKIANND